MNPSDRCGECGHTRGGHPGGGSCLHREGGCSDCRCLGYREHTSEDFPSDNLLKIAALCGVLDFQLDSVRFELGRGKGSLADTYLDDAEQTLSELRKLALARPAD